MDRLKWLPFLIFAVAVALGPRMAGNAYYLLLLTYAGSYAIVTIGLCVLIGYAGQISLGHAAFFALGGYTSAILTTRYDFPLIQSFAAVIVISIIVAYLIGVPALRLKGHYLAMATLGFGEIIFQIVLSNMELTGGSSGLYSLPPLVIFGIDLTKHGGIYFYYLIWAIVGLEILMAFNVIRSRPGRALMSIHGNEEAANAMGVKTQSYKLQMFVISAVFGSIAGFLVVHKDKFVGVDSAELMRSIIFVAMVAVGGMANIWGTLIATILLFMLPYSLTSFENYKEIIYGMIIILIMIFMPNGIFAGTRDIALYVADKLGIRKGIPD